MSITFTATYSAEDNKLRLYASERLESDLYKRVRDNGFKWAPKQELFVAPRWTPGREDICLELAGDITAELTTMVERASIKVDRLDDLAVKRASESNSFYAAATRISERFAAGQPILIGHHSERKARKDQERMHNAMDKAVKTAHSVDYWNYRAGGVERHANRKANPIVRARRIKTLLSELRERQRDINHAFICIGLWESVKSETNPNITRLLVEKYSGAMLPTGYAAPYLRGDSLWQQLEDGTKTVEEITDICLSFFIKQSNSPYTMRWISHILNRLSFERSELGDVTRFDQPLTAVILQTFARSHGAHKPKAILQDDQWHLSSMVPLPLHIADDKQLLLSASQWIDLMKASGYEVPVNKVRRKSTAKHAPLINPTIEEAKRLQKFWNEEAEVKHASKFFGTMKFNEVRELEQAVYSANNKGSYSPFKTIELDEKGHKIVTTWKGKQGLPVCRIRVFTKGDCSLYAPSAIVVITDKKQSALPISFSYIAEELQA